MTLEQMAKSLASLLNRYDQERQKFGRMSQRAYAVRKMKDYHKYHREYIVAEARSLAVQEAIKKCGFALTCDASEKWYVNLKTE